MIAILKDIVQFGILVNREEYDVTSGGARSDPECHGRTGSEKRLPTVFHIYSGTVSVLLAVCICQLAAKELTQKFCEDGTIIGIRKLR